MSKETDDLQSLAVTLGRVTSNLYILTARSGDRETGMLTSWVQQCAFEPPQITAAIRADREVLDWLEVGMNFTLNLLAEGQGPMVSHFGRGFRLDQPAFVGLNVERHEGQAPVLLDAMGYLFCQVGARVLVGDHVLLVAEVKAGKLFKSEPRPMVHYRKNGLRY